MEYQDILLVEDDETLRRIIAQNLTERHHRVGEASTAKEALRLAARARSDLLILDINLPDRSGWDVLRELQARGSHLPTIIISVIRITPARLAEFKPMAYLPKPFPIDALLRLVDGDAPDGGQLQEAT